MRFATSTPRPADTAPPGLAGTARVDRRTHALIPRLRPGDIAVIDHLDLDRGDGAPARGRGRRRGRQRAGDDHGPLREPRAGGAGQGGRAARRPRRARGPEPRSGTGARCACTRASCTSTASRSPPARRSTADRVAVQMARGSRRDGGAPRPASPTTPASSSGASRTCCCTDAGSPAPGRHSPAGRLSWSSPGHEHRAQLAGARRYLREARPVLVGVDRGADALLEAGHTPDIVVDRHRRRRRRPGLGQAHSRAPGTSWCG